MNPNIVPRSHEGREVGKESISPPSEPSPLRGNTFGLDHLLTYEQAASIVGGKATARFIKNEIKRGKLIGTDLGHRVKRVAPGDLKIYMNGGRTLENRRR